MRLIKYSVLVPLFFAACSTSETIIKPKEVTIDIPSITVKTDSLREIQSDSFDLGSLDYEATFEIPNAKDKAVVKVYPKQKKAVLTLPKQTAKTTIQDTTKYTIKKEITTVQKVGYMTYGIIGAIVLIIIGWVIWNKYGRIK